MSDDSKRFSVGDLIQSSQFNGIVFYGMVVGLVNWDGDGCDPTHYCVRYLVDPEGDRPRKPYTLVHVDDASEADEREASGYTLEEFC